MKQILMIINPRAGRSKPFEPLLQAMSLLSGHGWNLRVRLTAASGDATRIAREEGDGCDVCIAVGGDGTLNEVAAGLLELEHPPLLGYFPQGSTNDFAATLKIPGDPPAAAWAILNGEERRMDVGSWNGRSFLYVASFGAFTRSSYTAPQSVKNALGHAAYILEGVKDIETLRPYRVKITADGEVLDGEYLFGAVCNSTSIGGMMKLGSGDVVLDDGKFELLLIPNPKSPAEFQRTALALLEQKYDGEGLVFRHVSHIEMTTEENLPWSLDGEYAPGCSAVTVENHPGKLRMLL